MFFVDGGYQFDGSEITPIDYEEIDGCLKEAKSAGIKNIVLCGIFSPVRNDQENDVRNYILEKCPGFSVTVSHQIGCMNLLERENASILNECLKELCHETISRFAEVFEKLDLVCPIFFTQNDGTILRYN